MNAPRGEMPYHDRDGIVLHHGDALEVLPRLTFDRRPVVITDPIWPNGARIFPGVDAWALWGQAAAILAPLCCRLVVILGCDSDPRFLDAVPPALPFVRVCKLRFPAPSYKGAILVDFEVAYVFGEPFVNGDGEHRVLPGEARGRQGLVAKPRYVRVGGGRGAEADPRGVAETHPCPRNPDHVRWLVENFTRPDDIVLDPFSGSGTTLWACRELGRRAVGIEIDERWCRQTVDRLRQELLPFGGGAA